MLPLESLECRRLLAAAYYVAANGNDALDGRSPQTAWKTIARVNGKNWNPGDRIYFEGGKTFTAAGSASANLLTSQTSFTLSGSADVVRTQDVTVKIRANQTYKFSVGTKTTNPGPGDRRVGITFWRAGQQLATFYKGFRGTSLALAQWEFVAPPGFDTAMVWVSKKGDSSTFCAQDLSLQSISNGLVFDSSDSGSAAYPVTIGSFGTGRATLDARDGIGLWGGNVSGMAVNNINFTGSWNAITGSGGNAGVGIDFANTLAGDAKLGYIRVSNVDVKNFRWAGIRVSGWNGKSGFSDVRITDSTIHHNGDAGVIVRGEFSRSSLAYSNENVYLARVKAYNNTGIPDKGSNSGSGIQLTDTLSATVERCVAHDNGSLNNCTEGGPVGIWAFDASRITIQCNESYANKTGSGKDGAGFDLDGGVTNSTVQYNYSHDNDGPGFLLCQFDGARTWGKNIVRYNISQNDARRNRYGAATLTGSIANAVIEQNTFYVTPSTTGGTSSAVRVCASAGPGTHVRNNILQSTGGTLLLDIESANSPTTFNGNNYYSTGAKFRIVHGSAVYNALSTFRTLGHRELLGSTPTGTSIAPALHSAGTGTTLNDASKLSTLAGYRLLNGSSLINASLSLSAPFKGYVPAGADFFARAITTRPDVGASEFV